MGLTYNYDQNKRKLTETDSIMTNLSQTFSYDFENEAMKAKFSWPAQPEGQDHGWSQQNRLTSWSSNDTTLNQTQSWDLSLEGSWLSNTVNGVTENRTFNQSYETLFSNSNAMTYDRKGNLTTNKDGSIYTWESIVMDDERSLVLPARRASTGCAQQFDNQMAFSTAGTPSVNASYAYDAFGRRVSKSSNNTITIFVNSGYQILTEYASINNAPFAETQSFVYAAYIDDPITLISTNGTYFYHSNRQFSVGAITDSNGNISERYGYNAYGKPVVISDSFLVDNPYFFTGRQLDSETGLFYFRARYYDASLGQFISRDPIGYIDGLNLYRGYFVANKVDPTGLYDWNPGHPSRNGSRGTTIPILSLFDPRNHFPLDEWGSTPRPSQGGGSINANSPMAVVPPTTIVDPPNPGDWSVEPPMPVGFFTGQSFNMSFSSGSASATVSIMAIKFFCNTCYYLTVTISYTAGNAQRGLETPPSIDPLRPGDQRNVGGGDGGMYITQITGSGAMVPRDIAGNSTGFSLDIHSFLGGSFDYSISSTENSVGGRTEMVSVGLGVTRGVDASISITNSSTFLLGCEESY